MAGQSVSRLIAERNVALNNCRSVWKNLCHAMEKQELNYQRARAEKGEAALVLMIEHRDVMKARAEKAEAALAVEQAQVLAALQERDDLAVALAEKAARQ